MSNEELKAELLFKLYRKGIWGGKHTPLRNLYHFSNKVIIRESEKAVKELNNLDWVNIKISTNEKHISLNPHKNKEIKQYILQVLKINPSLLD